MTMNNKPVYLTAEGLAKLKAELIHLITVERPRVAARIHDAKLDGDITENAEYEDAKQEQSFLEGRIGTLEAQLKNAEVIEKTNGDKVGIGSKVVIKGEDGQETFTIVGSA
jgi:transcription elongation factor GreA